MAHVPRRIASFGLVAILLPVLIVLAPVVLVVSAVVDGATGRRDLPVARLYLFLIVFVAHEWVVIPYAGWLWFRGGFGRRLDYERHSRLQGWWTGSLFAWAERLLDIEIQWPDLSTIPSGTVLVLSRHASMVDAIIPAHLFPARLGREVHYVLKRELRWLPAIDVYGHRLGNHFVARGGNTDREIDAIAGLARAAPPGSALAIFPEGTYATATTRAKVRASLEKRGEAELVALADELDHLLPPKPAGTLAMLDEQPDADVVVFGHVGLEGVAEFGGLRRNLPADHPVVMRFWVHPRATLPEGDEERVLWLQARWRELDHWVGEQQRR